MTESRIDLSDFTPTDQDIEMLMGLQEGKEFDVLDLTENLQAIIEKILLLPEKDRENTGLIFRHNSRFVRFKDIQFN